MERLLPPIQINYQQPPLTLALMLPASCKHSPYGAHSHRLWTYICMCAFISALLPQMPLSSSLNPFYFCTQSAMPFERFYVQATSSRSKLLQSLRRATEQAYCMPTSSIANSARSCLVAFSPPCNTEGDATS